MQIIKNITIGTETGADTSLVRVGWYWI